MILDSMVDNAQMDQIIQEICTANHITRDTINELDIGYNSKG